MSLVSLPDDETDVKLTLLYYTVYFLTIKNLTKIQLNLQNKGIIFSLVLFNHNNNSSKGLTSVSSSRDDVRDVTIYFNTGDLQTALIGSATRVVGDVPAIVVR